MLVYVDSQENSLNMYGGKSLKSMTSISFETIPLTSLNIKAIIFHEMIVGQH